MKKTAIALVIAGLAAASVAQAAPQAETFYAGAKAGWASAHYYINELKDEAGESANRNSVTYGVFGGYQITDNFAVEAGYDYFGGVKARDADSKVKVTNHGAHLSLKASYPVIEGLDAYARVGAALVRTDAKETDNATGAKTKRHSLKVSPVVAAGVEYAILPELAVRVEYQWLNRVGKLKNADGTTDNFKPSYGSVTAGVSYRFGQGSMAPVAQEVNKTFSLNSDVLFAFNKANLKPQAAASLDTIYGEVAQLSAPAITVAGYTDRLGSDAYNLKLSQKRAETVANYLVSKGVAQDAITATGYGKANPVSGATCDTVKGRKALIACLAPDRRVEVSVKGNK